MCFPTATQAQASFPIYLPHHLRAVFRMRNAYIARSVADAPVVTPVLETGLDDYSI